MTGTYVGDDTPYPTTIEFQVQTTREMVTVSQPRMHICGVHTRGLWLSDFSLWRLPHVQAPPRVTAVW
jgi:hypothetical protein